MTVLTNRQILAAIKAVAEALNKIDPSGPAGKGIHTCVAQTLMVAFFHLGVMKEGESIHDLKHRLLEGETALDIADREDNQTLMDILLNMFSPFSSRRFLIVALSDDSGPVVTQLQTEDDPLLSTDSVKAIFRSLGDAEVSSVISI